MLVVMLTLCSSNLLSHSETSAITTLSISIMVPRSCDGMASMDFWRFSKASLYCSIYIVLEHYDDLQRGLLVLGDDEDGEVGLVGADFNGDLKDAHEVEVVAEEQRDGGDAHSVMAKFGNF